MSPKNHGDGKKKQRTTVYQEDRQRLKVFTAASWSSNDPAAKALLALAFENMDPVAAGHKAHEQRLRRFKGENQRDGTKATSD